MYFHIFLFSFYIGYLHKLYGNHALSTVLNTLAKQYGDVFSMYLGNRLVVVLNSKEAIHESFIKNPKQFSGRPDLPAMRIGSEGGSGLGGCNVTKEYKQNKLLTVRGFQDFISDRKFVDKLMNKEVKKMERWFEEIVVNKSSFCPVDCFSICVPAMILCVLFGEDISYSDPELRLLVKETLEQFELSESSSPADFLNYRIIHMIPNQRYNKLKRARMEKVQFAVRKINAYLDNEEKKSGILTSYFANFYRDLTVEKVTTKEIHEIGLFLSDLIAAGFNTVATTLTWAVLYLVKYPAVNERCREEINSIVGGDDLSIEHEKSLPYFVATIFDILRLSSVLPTALPHATTQDVKLKSFKIPQNTIILPNLWAVNHDPKVWKMPYDLYPEHYLKGETELDKPATKKMAAFSSGIRRCPGEKFAFYEMFFFLGTIIRTYDIKLVNPPVDMEPKRGFTAKPKPYSISLTRLKRHDKE